MPFQPSEMSEATIKRFVDNLARFNKSNPLPAKPKRAQLQEAVASMLGWSSYHHAITTLRNSESSSPSKVSPKSKGNSNSSEWVMPIPLGEAGSFVRFGELFFGQSTSNQNQLTVPASDFAGLVILLSKERNRRYIFRQLVSSNPGKPVLLISSSGSLLSASQFPSSPTNSHNLDFPKFLAGGTSEEIVELINSHMSATYGSSDMWVGRARSLMAAFIPLLVHQRQECSQDLTVERLTSSLDIENIVRMANIVAVPAHIRAPLLEYLQSLPGYSPHAIGGTMKEQHNYLRMQVVPVVQSLTRQGIFILLGSGLPSNCQAVIPDAPSSSDIARMESAINDWVCRHPGGVVFLDLLPLSKELWDMLLRRQAHWTDGGAAMWIGAGVKADIPEHILPRLLGRCQEKLSDGPFFL